MRQKTGALCTSILATLLASTMGVSQQTAADHTGTWGEELNLDFETAPTQWQLRGEGYEVRLVDDEQHTGRQSVRLRYENGERAGVAGRRFPVTEVRGQWLRYAGYVKTEDVTEGYAGLWIRVDGPDRSTLSYDDRRITGSTPWTRYEISLEVPREAVGIGFGALLTGAGTAWVDTLSFELIEAPPPPPKAAVRGLVKSPDGEPVAGAWLSFRDPGNLEIQITSEYVATGEDGRFVHELDAGNYVVTATAPDLAAAVQEIFFDPGENPELELLLTREGDRISGRVHDRANRPLAGARVVASRYRERMMFFSTVSEQNGHFSFVLPPSDATTYVGLDDEQFITPWRAVVDGTDHHLEINAARRQPASEAVATWIRENAVRLATAEPESGIGELQPLKTLIGEARVVGLGEATHGTREFFQLKHRIFEFLVEEMGFNVFAIEANWPETLAINDYVLHGKGDPRQVLAGIYYWSWNTEEVLELIKWMRRYNADPAHEPKIRFYGVDMQIPTLAVREAVAYVARLDQDWARELEATIAPLNVLRIVDREFSSDQCRALEAGIAGTLERLDAERARFVERTGERDWVLGRQHMEILRQVLELVSEKRDDSLIRDRAMARNVQWILDTEPPDTRVVIWAHNGHVARDANHIVPQSANAWAPMGAYLAEALGDDYVPLGFVFNQGSFRAFDFTQGGEESRGIREFTIGPAPPSSFAATFARTGLPIFVLDLRHAEGEAARWLADPHPLRSIGSGFVDEEAMINPIVLPAAFDGVIFVERTTKSLPVGVLRARQIENLRAFAKLYGYVRFFHPSDEASRIDWDKFAVYGAAKAKAAADRQQLRQVLEELFGSMAPTLRLYPTGEEPTAAAWESPEDTTGLVVVAWQHRGVGVGDRGPYRSERTHRVRVAGFGTISQGLPADAYRGKPIRLRAAVKTEVSGSGNQGQLWLRIDRPARQMGFFDNMDDRPITSREWQVYEILGEVAEDAERIAFGGFLQGRGKVWLDGFEIAVRDDQGAWQPVELANPGFEASSEQIEGWWAQSPGYRFAIDDQTAFRSEHSSLIEELGTWKLFDAIPAIGEEIRKELAAGLSVEMPLALYSDEQGTLPRSDVAEALVAELDRLDLASLSAEDESLRLGAVVIAWNVFQHFYPYFDVVATDWDAALTEALGGALDAESESEFYLTLKRLVTALRDGHGNVFHPQLEERRAWFPFAVGWVECQVVVTSSQVPEIRSGDLVVRVDGVEAGAVLSAEEQFLSGSPQWRRRRALGRFGLGEEGTQAKLELRRGDHELEVEVLRAKHDRIRNEYPTAMIEEVDAGVYYVDLRRAPIEEIRKQIDELAAARGVIFDLRGYPKGNHEVIRHLIDEPVQSAQWNVPELIYPDRERIVGWERSGRWTLTPEEPRFQGKIVFLTDSRAISYAESVLGIIEHYQLAEIVGQPTAGTNGNVNPFTLPGGFRLSWTGMKVLKHDDSQHHLIGIQPTVAVNRTIAAVIEGRDEYLEKALEIINR